MDINAADGYTNDFIEIQSIFDQNYETSITTASFDPYQELFWTGNSEVSKIRHDKKNYN
jgi:hypothetical protein